jgi:hypothetical protein
VLMLAPVAAPMPVLAPVISITRSSLMPRVLSATLG